MADDGFFIVTALGTLIISTTTVLKTALNTFAKVRRDRHMSEIQSKLLDRLGTAPDVMTYVNSDAYKRLFEQAPTGRNEYASRVLNGIQGGTVLLLAGVALLLLSDAGGFDTDSIRGMRVFGTIFAAVGLGLVASTAWSQRLLRRWGLLGKNTAGDVTELQ
jgi:hypothetical protein